MVLVRRAATSITVIKGCAALSAAVLVLTACGAQHTTNPATTSRATSSPLPHSSSSAATTAAVVYLPNQVLGRNKNTSVDAEQALSLLNSKYVSSLTALSKGLISVKTAIYGGEQNGATPFFFVVAGSSIRRIASPDTAVRSFRNDMLTRGESDATVFPAGPNGVATVCGHVQVDTICYWADHVSFGIVLYSPGFASSLNDAASKTSQIRSAVVR